MKTFAATPSLSDPRRERAALIARLGWVPEPPIAAERYCATTVELRQLVRERFGVVAEIECEVSK